MEILKLVPQIFHDLISRVIPGGIAIFAITVALDIKPGKAMTDLLGGAPALQESALILAMILLAGAYLVGQLISPLSDWFASAILTKLFSPHFRVLKNAVTSSTSVYPSGVQCFLRKELGIGTEADTTKISDRQYNSAIYLWFDWIRLNNPDAGARAAKIRAEYRMHEGMTVVFIVASGIHIAAACMSGRLSLQFVIPAFIAGVLSLLASVRTRRIFQHTVINNYYAAKINTTRGNNMTASSMPKDDSDTACAA